LPRIRDASIFSPGDKKERAEEMEVPLPPPTPAGLLSIGRERKSHVPVVGGAAGSCSTWLYG